MPPSRPQLQILMSVLCTALIYLTIGLPLAVLPGWVSGDLGFSAATAGLSISIQYVATIVSRGMVGPMVDTSGPKRAILIGLSCSVGSGVVLLGAAPVADRPVLALGALFASRIILGFGESLVGTGAIAWGIGRAGAAHTAKIISWNGIATYGAIALGAPLGVMLFHIGGMAAVGGALAIVGLGGLAFAWPQPSTQTISAERMAYSAVFARILPYGSVLGLGAIGFGVITSFISLYYVSHGWAAAWTAISAFGVAFVVARLMFVSSIARFGGLNVAFAFLAVEAAGLLTIWLAGSPVFAAIGAAAAGFGFALVFPALGMVVVDLVPAQNRGAAIGAYSMFTDIALCVTGPVAGLLTGAAGATTPFLFGGGSALLGLGLVYLLIQRPKASTSPRLR
jgi:MFS family permease